MLNNLVTISVVLFFLYLLISSFPLPLNTIYGDVSIMLISGVATTESSRQVVEDTDLKTTYSITQP